DRQATEFLQLLALHLLVASLYPKLTGSDSLALRLDSNLLAMPLLRRYELTYLLLQLLFQRLEGLLPKVFCRSSFVKKPFQKALSHHETSPDDLHCAKAQQSKRDHLFQHSL